MNTILNPSPLLAAIRSFQRFELKLLLGALVMFHGIADAQQPQREVFLPSTEKGTVVIVVSGRSGPGLYKDYSTKLASLGYYTVLVDGKDILIRGQDPDVAKGAANLQKVIAEAQVASQAVAGKVALVGFSRGGGGVLLHGAPLKTLVSAIVAYYPSITAMGPDMAPLASGIRVPVLLLSGEQDLNNNCCLIESMRALAAKANPKDFELVVYPLAGHGFNLSVPSVYRAEDANDAWARATSFLSRHHPPGAK